MKFHNKIDQIRKVADLFALFIFFILAYYFYTRGEKLLSYFMLLCGIADLIFTYDAIKVNGFNNLFKF